MLKFQPPGPLRPFLLQPTVISRILRLNLVRSASRYEAYDTGLDAAELDAARKWRQGFSMNSLPKGTTTFSRSSGPGGQHVNKTETKATTLWRVGDVVGILPKILHGKIRGSRYYTKNTDSITIQAQTQRSRAANAVDNQQKLFDEVLKIYEETVPSESDPEKAKKYKQVEKTFHEKRMKEKKKLSNKKQFRRNGGSED